MRLPQNKIWRQDNNSDIYGDIWSSWNLDLSGEAGKIKTTRLLTIARSNDDGSSNYVSGMGLAVAFRYYNDQNYAATNGTISKSGSSRTSSWGLDSGANKPTTISNRYSDMEVFNDCLYATLSGTSVAKNTAGTWSSISPTGMVSSVPHALCVYGDRLYLQADYAKIQSINTSDTSAGTIGSASNTLDLGNPAVNTITFMRPTSSRIWIGTLNRYGGKGHIYAWDGSQTSVNESYRLESSGAMAAVVKDDVLYVMDNDGRLLAFNGGTFVEIDKLPIEANEYLKGALFSSSASNYNERWIHPNGMTLKDNGILMLINNEYRGATATWSENLPSGIWEWTKETGLYHKYSPSYTNDNTTTVKDYGQNQVSLVGALNYIKSFNNDATDNGSLLAGVQVFDDASTTNNLILTDDLNDTVQKFGYFVTPKIFSAYTESWNKAYLRIKPLTTSGDEMIIKYRTSEEDPLDIDITTWSGSDSVKTSTSITGYSAGDEIEFLRGEGSGSCFTIVSTSSSGGLTEIKLDGSLTGIDSSGKARLQHWKQVGEPLTSTSKDIFEKPVDSKTSAWIQFKVCLKNTGNSYIYDFNLISKTAQNG